MAQDIFGRVEQVFGGGLSSDSMFMYWPAIIDEGGGVGLLVQNVSLQYSQPVRRIYELGPGIAVDGGQRAQYVYYIVGRPEGTFQMARIFGFASINIAFYSTYGSVCNDNPGITLQAAEGCNGNGNGSGATWTIDGVILQGVAMNASAQEMLVQESVSAMFIGLTLTEQDGQVGG